MRGTLEPSTTSPAVTFLAGGMLALVVSGGLLFERLSMGAPNAGLIVSLLMSTSALMTLPLVARRGSHAGAALPQLAGAVLGIVAVHLFLRFGWIAGAPWLSERPAQLVNDGVAVLATLGVVWGCADGFKVPPLLMTLLLLTAYRATGRLWHVDAAPHGFIVPVQDLVLAQFSGVAAALIVFRSVAPRDHR